MTPEKAKQLLESEVFRAFAEGKQLEFRGGNSGEWTPIKNASFDFDLSNYRIAQIPTCTLLGHTITVGNEWVHIGCRQFCKKWVRELIPIIPAFNEDF